MSTRHSGGKAENVWLGVKKPSQSLELCSSGYGFEPLEVRRVRQGDPQFGLHAGVRNLLAFGVEAPGHRREAGVGRVGCRRARHAQKLRPVGDDVLGRRRKIVRHVENMRAGGKTQRRFDRARDVVDVDAVGDLPRLEDTACRAGAKLVDGAAAWTVNAGQPKDDDGLAGLSSKFEPAGFSLEPS